MRVTSICVATTELFITLSWQHVFFITNSILLGVWLVISVVLIFYPAIIVKSSAIIITSLASMLITSITNTVVLLLIIIAKVIR